MRLLFLGDIVGRPGKAIVSKHLEHIRVDESIDIVIGNGENVSGGLGITPDDAKALFTAGVDVLTSGNHIWKHKSIFSYLEKEPRLLRPANYPKGAVGKGYNLYSSHTGQEIAVINLMGRTYMQAVDCPFQTVQSILQDISLPTPIFVDFHAEATSEKMAMGYFLQGKVSAVIGTHTHIQTNDARVLSGKTAYITDTGMCGPKDSILGMDPDVVVRRFLSGMPERFRLAKGESMLQAVVIEINHLTGHALSIEPYTTLH